MTQIRKLGRISTGVPGLDFITDGGFFETGVYIVQGGAGCGKTILSNQICFHHAKQGRQAVYYTLLTESHDRMLAFMHDLAFFDASAISKGVTYVSGFKVLEAEGLPGVVRSVRDTMAAQRPTLFVIDGVVSAEEIAPNDTVFKKFLHEIQSAATMFRCTMLLLTNTGSAKRLQAEHTMVDGIIELRYAGERFNTQRTIEVSKFRGAGQRQGPHTLEISKDGIAVQPRIETTLAAAGPARRPTTHSRASFGVAGLDKALGGGLLTATNTMLLGPSGSGKTLLGIHLLNAGALAGESGLFYTFYEHEEELVAKARRLGMAGFADGVESGLIRVHWQTSVEANLDRAGNDLVRVYEAFKPKRVFIDGMHGFHATADPQDRIEDFFGALADYFTTQESTFLFSSESNDLLAGETILAPFENASRICQNILVLRYTELRGRVERVLAMVKMRDSDFDTTIRLVTVKDGAGVHVGDGIPDADQILTGQPRRLDRSGT